MGVVLVLCDPRSVNEQRGPQLSQDGRFWWDGQRWQPVPNHPTPASSGPNWLVIAAGVFVGVLAVVLVGLWVLNLQDDGKQRDCDTSQFDRELSGESDPDCD